MEAAPGSRVEKADRTVELRQLEVEEEYLGGRKNTKKGCRLLVRPLGSAATDTRV